MATGFRPEVRQKGAGPRPRLLSALLALMAVGAASAKADEAARCEMGRFAVGNTGILCVRAPCPWRGSRLLDAEDQPGPVHWAQPDLPALLARPEERARLTDAWDDHECLVVEGAFDQQTLAVVSILGTCREVFAQKAKE